VEDALVITGSDKAALLLVFLNSQNRSVYRPGTGGRMFRLRKRKKMYVQKEQTSTDRPLVKYRGIFINDEAPAFSGWTKEKFGGVNHLCVRKNI
jgi:hypothetical protein